MSRKRKFSRTPRAGITTGGYGNYITPAIWAAVISSQYNRQTDPSGDIPARRGLRLRLCLLRLCLCLRLRGGRRRRLLPENPARMPE